MTGGITPEQRRREQSIQFSLSLDYVMVAGLVTVVLLGGSLTMLAEAVRAGLMTLIEAFALVVMKRVHRGRLTAYEFGSGKVEQLVNLLIAGGMMAGAVWIAIGLIELAAGGRPIGSPATFVAAAVLNACNTYVNVLAWDAMRRAARGGGSLIMRSQLQARIVKLVTSIVVQLALTIAAISTDAVVIAWADALGAAFVTVFIVRSALDMLRTGLPDLIDRSVHEEVQAAINRMLARHYDDYDQLDRVRTRRSGDQIYAEIALGFRPDLTVAEIDARIGAMKASLRDEVGEVDVSITAAAC